MKNFKSSAAKIKKKITKGDIYKNLKKLGFKRHRYDWCPVFVSDKFVVKSPDCICGRKPGKYSVPTTKFVYDSYEWFIQPRCDRRNAKRAYEILSKKCPSWDDPAPRNCGWLNGKPVIFDW